LKPFPIVWLVFFCLVLPVITFLYTRKRGTEWQRILQLTFVLLFIPLVLIAFPFVVNWLSLGFDSAAIRASAESPREFFIALDAAEKPFVDFVLVCVALQMLIALTLVTFTVRGRAFAFGMGLGSVHLAVTIGFVVLNQILGSWPRT